ncbi:hypothetical protein [Novosphingobium sp. CECT 9465]|uniref:hypothetical protein n=1 Tax=Novosphingobium sp. CECT 9465 TaxID=2829794 RepID=UPI001E364274|nr:hypothetical protein [Novosphingobium sp. CECT 9465]
MAVNGHSIDANYTRGELWQVRSRPAGTLVKLTMASVMCASSGWPIIIDRLEVAFADRLHDPTIAMRALVQLWLSIANSSRNTASCASLSSTSLRC